MQHITNYIKNHYLLLLSLVVILIIYIFVDIRMYQTKTTPTGDEPDFLLIAHSIAYDRDINIKNNEVNKDWRNFFSEDTLVVRYGWGNYKYPLFNFGFPLVLSIPYRLGGCLGTMFFNSFLMVLLFFSIYFITCRMLNLERMNPLGIWILALSTPFFTFSSQIYPDIIVGLIVLWDLYIMFYYPEKKYLHALLACSFVILAFFHLKYFILIGLMGGLYILKANNWTKRIFMAAWVPFVLFLFLLGNYLIYGQFHYRAAYPKFSLSRLGKIDYFRTFQTHLFDPQYGIVFHTPILLIVPFGLYCLIRSNIKYKYWYAFSILVLFFGFSSFFCLNPTFHIGWGTAGRQLFPLMPLLAILLMIAFYYGKGWMARGLQLLLFIPGLFFSVFGVMYPQARYNFPYYLNKEAGIRYKWMPRYWEYWDPMTFTDYEPRMNRHAPQLTVLIILTMVVITGLSIYWKHKADQKSKMTIPPES